MHWIVQSNLLNPRSLQDLCEALARQRTPFTQVKLIPLFNVLDGPAPVLHEPVFVYGSTGLGQVAKAQGWNPGYFDENLDYELMLQRYGELALNANATCSTLQDAQALDGPFFIRPVLDNKAFAGSVMNGLELQAFREGVARVADEPDATLRLSDRVAVASLVPIEAEYRTLVIDGRVVAASLYKLGDRARTDRPVPADVWAFAQHCSKVWSPNRAYTLDVAMTSAGPRVLELNSANSAGLYGCDLDSFVAAVNPL